MRLLYKIIYIILILAGVCAHAQSLDANSVFCDSIIDGSTQFRVNRSNLSEGTQQRLRHFIGQVDTVIGRERLKSITVSASASPEGPVGLNRRLSQQRAAAVRDFIIAESGLQPQLVTILPMGEDWDLFRRLVLADSAVPAHSRVLDIIDGPGTLQGKERALRHLRGGDTWRYLMAHIMPKVRVAVVSAYYCYTIPRVKPEPEPEPLPAADTVIVYIPEPEPVVTPEPEPEPLPAAEPAPAPGPWQRHAYVKTNMPAWAMLWTNVAGEYDIAPHWSVGLALYYSGWNYFTGHTKFRTFAVMPEMRYWFRGVNDGFYLQSHPGMVFYNVAFGGDKRYQDHRGRTPALGGGIGAGYRLALPRNPRWKFEFSLGAGIYHLDYDIFVNRVNGLQTDRRKRTFYGLDQVAASVCYTFDIYPKGGRR